MSARTPPLKYEDVCKYVGRLFLESQHQIDRVSAGDDHPMVAALRDQLEAERRRVADLELRLQETAG